MSVVIHTRYSNNKQCHVRQRVAVTHVTACKKSLWLLLHWLHVFSMLSDIPIEWLTTTGQKNAMSQLYNWNDKSMQLAFVHFHQLKRLYAAHVFLLANVSLINFVRILWWTGCCSTCSSKWGWSDEPSSNNWRTFCVCDWREKNEGTAMIVDRLRTNRTCKCVQWTSRSDVREMSPAEGNRAQTPLG